HDAFALFSQVMRSAKGFYEQSPSHPQAGENAIVLRSRRIFEDLLPNIDPEVASHLLEIEIVPQVFLMRWIRLLFGREFAFDDVLSMWDIVFAEDPTLEIVDYICLGMILRIRWELLDADYNSALSLLLRYPSESPNQNHSEPPQSLVLDALYLRSHPDTDGSGYLILKYTGRPLQPLHRPTTPPALQRNITAFSGVPSLINTPPSRPSSSSARRLPTNLESVLQSTARTLYARGGQAVRGAVEEVHKRAQEIQKSPTPSLPPRATVRDPRALERRLGALERRNKMLAGLLEGAVGELWGIQGLLAGREGEKESVKEGGEAGHVEALSLAIARVQFVQVYLGDSSLPLSEMDEAEGSTEGREENGRDGVTRGGGESEKTSAPGEVYFTQEKMLHEPGTTHEPTTSVQEELSGPKRYDTAADDLADPSTFEVDSDQPTPPNNEPAAAVPEITVQAPETTDYASADQGIPAERTEHNATTPPPRATTSDEYVETPPKHHRPALSESSYSWMLGQDKVNASTSTSGASRMATAPASATATRMPEKGRGGTGLFGDGDGEAGDDDNDAITVVHSSRRVKVHC
ncbi:hypothetical protein B0A55_12361, partial [Friedmanniomyces simplex]